MLLGNSAILEQNLSILSFYFCNILFGKTRNFEKFIVSTKFVTESIKMNLHTSSASFWNGMIISNLLILSNLCFIALYWHSCVKYLCSFFGSDSTIVNISIYRPKLQVCIKCRTIHEQRFTSWNYKKCSRENNDRLLFCNPITANAEKYIRGVAWNFNWWVRNLFEKWKLASFRVN